MPAFSCLQAAQAGWLLMHLMRAPSLPSALSFNVSSMNEQHISQLQIDLEAKCADNEDDRIYSFCT